ncbi:MSMEG_0565 family glycosyltransferase [Methylocystis sp. JR02]|uniref:MSMEG_0565 family glycosyltransferase n=1 Tax=Methylocystis sp. JR02 TaxID=3046284 RepID=UPI0024BBD8E5|nr:MSMEG_0565 family glycosyltransferase [Methylocystis sp. JR02]MDJ0450823.1 MSMEG_0565 family glycosyltransferase [Methylocystis sp. JR02]
MRSAPSHSPRVALTTYSTKPRGGVVHTLELAEALQAAGLDVTVIAMGEPGSLFRKVAVPVEMIATPPAKNTLEERVFDWIDALTGGLTRLRDSFDIVHSQDCISARAAARVRDAGARFRLVRTVHHVDDFTTQALMDCQRNAILEPDHVLVVSKTWQDRLRVEYGVDSSIVTNGVRSDAFANMLTPQRRAELRRQIGTKDRFLYLTIGGVEPRKGTEFLVRALAQLKAERSDPPVLAIIGGHSFQDYRDYREQVLTSLWPLGLELGKDVVLLQTLPQTELVEWLAAADGFVFPSIKEGWGLVIMEAASAGLPVVASDIDVFREFLVHDRDAILTETSNPASLARGMARLMDEPHTVKRLVENGLEMAARHSWDRTADQHIRIYNRVIEEEMQASTLLKGAFSTT